MMCKLQYKIDVYNPLLTKIWSADSRKNVTWTTRGIYVCYEKKMGINEANLLTLTTNNCVFKYYFSLHF